MRVMIATHSSARFHYWAGKYPGWLGWLVGPGAISKTKFHDWVDFALDNDAFTAWKTGADWSESNWMNMIVSISKSRRTPLWALIPDVVSNREATLDAWEKYHKVIDDIGWQKAFAVQDGMEPSDVPKSADLVFVGGTEDWKWKTIPRWAKDFDRVHVGRVNTMERLWRCFDLGVESIDGTGWFRDGSDNARMTRLENFFEGKRQLNFHGF